MTEREFRLRSRIDKLIAERDAARRATRTPSKRAGKRTRHCIYCGARTQTSRIVPACSAHVDLLSLDPLHNEWAA